MKQIGIIGCGWFGLPLALALKQEGHKVIGTKRSIEGCQQLASLGITAYPLELNDDAFANNAFVNNISALLECQVLVVNIPPGLRQKAGKAESRYLELLSNLVGLIGPRRYQKLVFISTTGVYPSRDNAELPLSEADAVAHNESSEVLLNAEALFASMDNSCILRFAGLVGPNRHPGRFFAGKAGISGANVAINLVHLDDCIDAVIKVINADKTAPIYNIVAPIHPNRGEFYPLATAHLGLVAPVFNQDVMPTKVISGALICQQLGFVYQYPDPLKMLYAC
jgi:nucleoside-diphosphate-sugar epimerase